MRKEKFQLTSLVFDRTFTTYCTGLCSRNICLQEETNESRLALQHVRWWEYTGLSISLGNLIISQWKKPLESWSTSQSLFLKRSETISGFFLNLSKIFWNLLRAMNVIGAIFTCFGFYIQKRFVYSTWERKLGSEKHKTIFQIFFQCITPTAGFWP